MKKHDWRDNDAEGVVTYYRATFHGGQWALYTHLRGEEDWERQDPMTLEHLRMVRDVLWRKYQRRRCPWEEVDRFDKFIEEAEEELAEKEAAEAEAREAEKEAELTADGAEMAVSEEKPDDEA